ncbi:Peroxidase [Hordeum vulgare]|nr:Peroxidase [Hordeum vulgare]
MTSLEARKRWRKVRLRCWTWHGVAPHGSNLVVAAVAKSARVGVVVAGAVVTIMPSSPGLLGSDAECVLNGSPICTPSSYRRSSGGFVRAPKMTAGRKPAANPAVLSLPSSAAPSSGGLLDALGSVGANAKAKRSKATPVS